MIRFFLSHGDYGPIITAVVLVYLILVGALFLVLNDLFFKLSFFESITLEISKKRKTTYRFLIYLLSGLIVFLAPYLYLIVF